MGMKEYVVKRAARAVLTVFIILTIDFFLFRILPGDPVRLLIRDPRVTPETLKVLQASFGLDKPLIVQYLLFLANTLQGNLAFSFGYSRPVSEILGERLLNTVLLVGGSTLFAILFGMIIGAVAAWKRGTKIDIGSVTFSLLMWSAPTFWLAMIMVIAAAPLGLPVAGMMTPGIDYSNSFEWISDVSRHLLLPMITYTLIMLGEFALILRNALIDVLTEDYILTARAKGLTDGQVLKDHALGNAMLPMITIIAINLGIVVAGAIQTEIVFSWPGVGKLIYDAILRRDYPLLQGAFIVLTIAVVGANFLADLTYAYLDPRIKYT